MAILRAVDGTYYEIPDDQVAKFKIPEDHLKEKLGGQQSTEGPPSDEPPPEQGGASSPMVSVHIHYAGQAPGGAPGGAEAAVQPYDWRNWHNWRNWRNWNNWRNRHD